MYTVYGYKASQPKDGMGGIICQYGQIVYNSSWTVDETLMALASKNIIIWDAGQSGVSYTILNSILDIDKRTLHVWIA